MVYLILYIFGQVTNYASHSYRKVWQFYVIRVLSTVRKLDRNNTIFIAFSYQKIRETELQWAYWKVRVVIKNDKSSGTLHSADELTITSVLPDSSSIKFRVKRFISLLRNVGNNLQLGTAWHSATSASISALLWEPETYQVYFPIPPTFKLTIFVLIHSECKKVKCALVQALRLCTGRTAHRGSRNVAILFLEHGTRRGEGSESLPGRSLPPGKTRYPLYRRLVGPQGRSGLVRKISPPPGFDPGLSSP
jgi:hypothetical protein